MPRWTHRKTWADGRDDDRVILRDGVRVGRVYREVFGPLKGQWQFFGMWVRHDNSGRCGTLQEALETIRTRAPRDEWIYDRRK